MPCSALFDGSQLKRAADFIVRQSQADISTIIIPIGLSMAPQYWLHQSGN